MTPKNNIVIGIIIALLVVASYNVEVSPVEFVEGLPNLMIVLEEMIAVEPKYIPTALWAMFETIQMAFIGTVIGIAIALPLSLLAARNLNSKFVYAPIRAFLAAIRTFPSILWALLFVIMVGSGTFAGVLAITMYTIGFIANYNMR